MLKKMYENDEFIGEASKLEPSAMELQEWIVELEENIPDKRTKNYKLWLVEINKAMKEYNSKFGKIYKLIK